MFTRGGLAPQYGSVVTGAPPPHHAVMPGWQHAPSLPRHGGGGLAGGAVTLTASAPAGMQVGNTGYGYLGMDPSAPETWIRQFNPAPGMISFLNYPGYGGPLPQRGGAVRAEVP